MNLRNHPKPSIQTTNTIKMIALIVATTTTAIAEATTVFIDRMAIKEAERANAIYTKRRTAIYKDIYQRNRSALKKIY